MLKFFKRIIVVIVVIAIAFCGVSYYTYRKSIMQKEERRLKAEEEKKLQEKLLKEKIDNAKKMIESVSNEVQIVALREIGEYTIYHDKTPDNNQWLEWIINSEIEVNMNYEAVFTIDVNKISIEVSDVGTVEVSYNTSDIEISAVDISDIIPAETKSLFGEDYTPSEISALEAIAKEKIQLDTMTEENVDNATLNLDSYFYNLAKSFNIDKISIKHN